MLLVCLGGRRSTLFLLCCLGLRFRSMLLGELRGSRMSRRFGVGSLLLLHRSVGLWEFLFVNCCFFFFFPVWKRRRGVGVRAGGLI